MFFQQGSLREGRLEKETYDSMREEWDFFAVELFDSGHLVDV